MGVQLQASNLNKSKLDTCNWNTYAIHASFTFTWMGSFLLFSNCLQNRSNNINISHKKSFKDVVSSNFVLILSHFVIVTIN